MKRFITTTAAAALLAAPAHASIYKDKWIDATLECLTYSSEVNCDKAASAGLAYAHSLAKNPDPNAAACAAMASSTGAMGSVTAFLGSGKADLQDSFDRALSVCQEF